jgi:hypothetical protein
MLMAKVFTVTMLVVLAKAVVLPMIRLMFSREVKGLI